MDIERLKLKLKSTQRQHLKSAPNKSSYISLIVLSLLLSLSIDADESQSKHNRYAYLDASIYTHLAWEKVVESLTSVRLLDIKNYSGIPIENRNEEADYYYHGKIPEAVKSIIENAVISSRYFQLKPAQADYSFEFSIIRYKLPYDYESGDNGWRGAINWVSRYDQYPAPAEVELTLKVIGDKVKDTLWSQSVSMRLSNCDLNKAPQPQTQSSQNRKIIDNYLSTSPGQAFLAATNYLLLKAIQNIHQDHLPARIEFIQGNNIHLISDSDIFVQGDLLPVFYNQLDGLSIDAAGQLEIVKTMGNRAIAYPVNLRADHLRAGDKIQINTSSSEYQQPQSVFSSVNECAQVVESTPVNNILSRQTSEPKY
jgi:hypothetical protein